MSAIPSSPDNDSTIHSIETNLFRVPLKEVLTDAKHGDHTHFELITSTVTLQDGSSGTGYTYTGGLGGHAILAMLEHDLPAAILGKAAHNIDELNELMQWHIHYVGRGGIASFAISAIDIALWDIKARLHQQPLWQLLGSELSGPWGHADDHPDSNPGHPASAAAYCGGIDLNFSLDKLLTSIQSYLDAGYSAVKIKVGKSNLSEDIERVKAVREHIGSEVKFMVDANYGLNPDQAIEAAHAFAPYDLLWFEEPIIPEDHAGYRRIASETGMPLAMGENQHTLIEFETAIVDAGLSWLMPDLGNCGGISVFLQVAERARQKGIPVCTHGMQELSVSVLAGIKSPGYVEVHSFPIHEYCQQPLTVSNQRLIAPENPGIGVNFDWQKLAPHLQASAKASL